MDKFINFKVQPELYERVKAKSEELNISMASLVRIAIVEYLKKGE